jgi:hypothetical protein
VQLVTLQWGPDQQTAPCPGSSSHPWQLGRPSQQRLQGQQQRLQRLQGQQQKLWGRQQQQQGRGQGRQ